jgi:hypothetical protein
MNNQIFFSISLVRVAQGKSLGNALYMAQTALAQWLNYLSNKKQNIPDASTIDDISIEPVEFVNLIRAEEKDSRAVKRTISIPKWMDDKVLQSGLSLSRVLQESLNQRLA